MKKISIVTPTYNSGKFLEEAIQSVLDQEYENFEHIIIDNCSTDNTEEIFNNYDHLIIISEPDKSQSDAINKGFRIVKGDIFAWLNADDWYERETFKKVNEIFTNSNFDVVYGDIHNVDKNGNIINSKKEPRFNYFTLLYYRCYIESTATFFNRRILDDGHYLDEKNHPYSSMDYEYYVRLAKLGYSFYHTPNIFASFRWHEQNISLDQRMRLKGRTMIQSKYGIKIFRDKTYNTIIHRFLRAIAYGIRVLLKLSKSLSAIRSWKY